MRKLAPFEQFVDALVALFVQNADFVFEVAAQALFFTGFDRERALIFFLTFPREDLDVDNRAIDARRRNQRSVFHVRGLLAEDRTQEFFFSGQLGFALGRNFAHEDRAGLDLGADANDAALVEVAEHILADVGNIAGDFFRPELGVTGLDLQLFDVNRSVVVVFHQTLGHQDRVFKVVTAPRHERDQNVAAQGELAAVGARPVRNHLALRHAFTNVNNRTLIDTGVLVRTLKLDQRVDIRGHLSRDRAVNIVISLDDDALGIRVIDHAIATRDHYGA